MRPLQFLKGAALLAFALGAPGAAHSQQASKAGTPADSAYGKISFAEIMLGASVAGALSSDSATRAKSYEDAGRMARDAAVAYRTLAADPRATNLVIENALQQFYTGKVGARGAVQVSQTADEQQIRLSLLRAAQDARIIEQNDRIILLLEQIAKKK